MSKSFHLSIGVHSLEESIHFFTEALGGKILHKDPKGYVNLDIFHNQITIKQNQNIKPELPDFHFGFNMNLNEFDQIAERIINSQKYNIIMLPKVIDPGTKLERKKMCLKCPTGYLIELKGYRSL